MKKTATLALAFLLCTLFCLGAAAFEMESVESAAEAIAKDLEPSAALSGELESPIRLFLTMRPTER